MLRYSNLTSEIEHYQREGYCLVQNAFSPGAVRNMEQWLNTASDKAQNTTTLEPEFEPSREDGTRVVRKIRRLFWNDPPFWQGLLEEEGLFELARNIVSSSPALVFHAAFMKPGKVGSKVAFHQDQALWTYTYPNAANMWVAVTPSTLSNGCLHICPGSHRKGLIEHKWLPDYPNHQAIDVAALGMETKPVEMQPGDMLVWNRFMAHGSEENRSTDPRKGVVMVFTDSTQPDFRAKDLFVVPEPATALN